MQRCMHAYIHYIIGYQCINMPDGGKYANFVLLKIFETINSNNSHWQLAISRYYLTVGRWLFIYLFAGQ